MKSKVLVLVVCLFTLTFASFAQQIKESNGYDVIVSVKESTIPFYSKSVPINVKITNNSESIINTKQIGFVMLKLNKNLSSFEDKSETAYLKIEPKYLKKTESLEFQVDLKKVFWQENPQSSYFEISPEKRPKYEPFFLGTYFLSIVIGDCRKVTNDNSLLKSEHRNCESNRVFLNFESVARVK